MKMTNARRIYLLFSMVTVLSMLAVSACTTTETPTATTEIEAGPTAEAADTEVVPTEEAPPPEELTMTDVGTPRSETLIVDAGYGGATNPDNYNPFSGLTSLTAGYAQFHMSYLWEIHTPTGEQFPAMAAEPLTALDDTYTKWQIKLREGLYWSDGVEITAEDIAFSIGLYYANPTITNSAVITALLKDNPTVVDKYILEIETHQPTPRLQQQLGVLIVSSQFLIVPKHIWEDVDALTYENNPPIGSGPYFLNSYDPNGNWWLWERREDWDRTDVGMIYGMPVPKYIYFKAYGTEEKRVLAAINNDLDVLMDISPESWEILRTGNPDSEAWFESFPWADFDDPCERGMMLNWLIEPYDKVEVRWALALATDMISVTQATYDGMLRVSPLAVPPIEILQSTYHLPMQEWLEDFTLPDGYKPFDPDFAIQIGAILTENGVEGISTDPDELRSVFGVGWWKYDVEEAAKLLESVGFTRDADGKWLLPDGTPWTINIMSPVNYEAESERLSFAVAESWNKFGIDTVVDGADIGTWYGGTITGGYSVANQWFNGCAIIPDLYTNMSSWHSKNLKPIGEVSSYNTGRINSPEIDAILDQLEPLTPDDPQVIDLSTELLKEMVREMAWIPMVGTSKFVPVTTYWWDGFPNYENMYNGPWWWWAAFKYITPFLEPTGNY
jgi:peptide/nickel transport system substrate-binding protein